MASSVDVTVPAAGTATTASVRANFTTIKSEIEALQSGVVSVTATGSSTARTLAARAADAINVLDFGADATGVSDSTTAISAALARAAVVYAANGSGAVVKIPAGTYRTTSKITVSTGFVSIVGDGASTTTIQCEVSDDDAFLFSDSGGGLIEKVHIEGIRFLGWTLNTAGSLLHFIDPYRVNIADVYAEGGPGSNNAQDLCTIDGSTSSNTAGQVRISNSDFVRAKGYGLRLIDLVDVYISDTRVDCLSTTAFPIWAQIPFGALLMSNVSLLNGDKCRFEDSSFLTLSNVYFDSAQNAVELNNCYHAFFTNCEFANRPGGGVSVETSRNVGFSQCVFANNGTFGASVNATSSAFSFSECQFDANNTGNTAGVSGLEIAAGAVQFHITQCQFGNYTPSFTGHQKYGIEIASGAANYYSIVSNTFSGNETGDISDGGTGAAKFISGNFSADFGITASQAPGVSYLGGISGAHSAEVLAGTSGGDRVQVIGYGSGSGAAVQAVGDSTNSGLYLGGQGTGGFVAIQATAGTNSLVATPAGVAISGNTTLGDASGDSVTINAGTVSAPNIPAATAYVSAAVDNVTGDGTQYTVIFDTERFDQGADYNTTTGVFTFPATGKYLVAFSVRLSGFSGTHDRTYAAIVTSNLTYDYDLGGADLQDGSEGRLSIGGTAIVDAEAADTAHIVVQVSGSTKTVQVDGGAAGSSYISIMRVA